MTKQSRFVEVSIRFFFFSMYCFSECASLEKTDQVYKYTKYTSRQTTLQAQILPPEIEK